MGLNPRDGNMYEFITHTWNTVKGKCYHGCTYCIVRNERPLRLDKSEFDTNLRHDLFIFVGSGTDLFAENIPEEWILATLNHCYEANNNLFGNAGNRYMFQSKNPRRIIDFINHRVFKSSVVCTTIETNRWYPEIMNNCPRVEDRAEAMEDIALKYGIDTYVTAEPLMDFDLDEMVYLLRKCMPQQVNIGSNTNYKIELPEPSLEKTEQLITEVEKFSKVEIKRNLKRKRTL